MRHIYLAIVVLLAASTSIYADYTLTPEVNGQSSFTTGQSWTFSVDLMLDSDANDAHFASLFTVEFSASGMVYGSYSWGAPYVTGGSDDWSNPSGASLPKTIDINTYVGPPGFDPNAIDIWFENLVPVGDDPNPIDVPFTTGNIVTLQISVPYDFPAGTSVIISTNPDTFDDGNSIPTTGGSLVVNVELMGDINASGYVDDDDLSLLLSHWNQCDVGWAEGDMTGDTCVDDNDLSLLLANWNDGTPPPMGSDAIPEPMTAALMMLGSMAVIARRRRS